MPQISIIVPVYKTEKYIHRCIESILNQTFKDFELILIDDGSPDQCPLICDEYALKDTRVQVIHKDNAGVAAARNSGLDIAKGEYITFVDSDDWIEQEMYQSMMETARKFDCDVVMCDCVKDYPDHSEIYTHDIREGFYNYKQLKNEYYPHLLMMENVEYPPTISNWLCLFRRSLGWKKHSNHGDADQCCAQQHNEFCLRYVEGVRFSEDLFFGAQMMYQARSFYYLRGNTYYHYCMNPASVTHTFHADKWDDYVKLHRVTEQFFLEKTDFDFRYQIDLMLLFFVYNAVGEVAGASQLKAKQKISIIKSILYTPCVREMFHRVCIRKLPIFWKLKVYTYAYKYVLGIRIMVSRKKYEKKFFIY